MTIYKVKFSEEAKKYRMRLLSLLDGVEMCEYPSGIVYVECADDETAEAVEYELRKADRRDDYCDYAKI